MFQTTFTWKEDVSKVLIFQAILPNGKTPILRNRSLCEKHTCSYFAFLETTIRAGGHKI